MKPCFPFESPGASNPIALQVKQVGEKTDLDGQGAVPGTKAEKENILPLEERCGFTEGVQSYSLHLQGENQKRQSSS